MGLGDEDEGDARWAEAAVSEEGGGEGCAYAEDPVAVVRGVFDVEVEEAGKRLGTGKVRKAAG